MDPKKDITTPPTKIPNQKKRLGDQFLRDVPDTPYYIMNWHGFEVVVGSGKGPYFFNEINIRRKKNESIIIVITGPPGKGKSYFALRLGEIFDALFSTLENGALVSVVFDRAHLLRLIGENTPLHRGQVIVIDEAQYVAGARRWYDDVQKDVMDNLEAVRSQGFIIIIVALHLNLLDVIIRKYVLSHMIHMEERGHGTYYWLYTPRFANDIWRTRKGQIQLQLPDYEKCSSIKPDCLVCPHNLKCMTIRAIYERQKKAFLNERNREAREKAEKRNKPATDFEDLIKKLITVKDKLVYTQKGFINKESISVALEEEFNVELTTREVLKLRSRATLKHPNIFVPPPKTET